MRILPKYRFIIILLVNAIIFIVNIVKVGWMYGEEETKKRERKI